MTSPFTTMLPQIHYLRASAGAGKTYQLTIRFISLLAGMEQSAEGLRQIMAITFTNRAAAEMKERIILTLKQIALGAADAHRLSHETGLQPADAAAWLDIILTYFSDFHVRTIDSLVYALLRAFALEMGIRPDLEVSFDYDAILNQCFDRFLSRTEWVPDDQRYQLLSELLDTYLSIEEAGGMLVERGIRRKLLELYKRSDGSVSAGALPDLNSTRERLHRAALNLLGELMKRGVSDYLNKRIFKSLYLEDPINHLEKSLFTKTSLQEILTSKASSIADNDIDHLNALYKELRHVRDEYLQFLALAKVHAYMRTLEELYQEIRVLSERKGLILGGGWHVLVTAFLEEEQRTSTFALLKLGSRVQHFLIDEFQDTSRSQWSAISPLVEESLSVGGSLFYVGDVKQAIYGWRGGDWRLFEEVAAEFFPSVPSQSRKEDILTVNYRSRFRIVEFNNELYYLLTDDTFLERFAEMIIGKEAGEEEKVALSRLIRDNFKDVEQTVAPHTLEGNNTGKVTVAPFEAPTEELRHAVRERLVHEVHEVWERRNKKGIAVLVRRNLDAEDIATWLMTAGIPVVTENSLRLRSSDLIKGVTAFLRFLEYPLDDLSFWGAVASRLFQGLQGLPDADRGAWLEEGLWQPPIYKAFEHRFPTVSEEFIRPLLGRVGFVTPYDLSREVVERFHLFERFAEEQVFIHRFFELIFQAEAGGQRSLSHFLQFWDEGGMEEKIGLPEDISAVRILTIHKAKGLEFPVVFVPFTNWRLDHPRFAKLDDGRFVNIKKPLPAILEYKRRTMINNSVLEALNLLYVATTRAEEELYLYVTCLPKGSDRGYLSTWLRAMLVDKGWPGI